MGLLGSFVSGFGLLGAIGIEGNKKAAKKAEKAAERARQENLALFKGIYDQSRADLAPYNQAGQQALSRLQQRTGLTPINRPASAPGGSTMPIPAAPGAPVTPSVQKYQTTGFGGQQAPAGYYFGPNDQLLPIPGAQTSGQPAPSGPVQDTFQPTSAPAQASGPDWQAYLRDNPDVAAAATAEGRDPTEYAQAHYQAFGQQEGRALPTVGAPDPNAPPDEYFQETYAPRPDALQVPTYERQQALDAPSLSGFIDPSKFQVDPGYQFRLKEGLGAVNAASAARGKLRSGDAARALQERGEGLANQGYNDWYNRQLAAFDRTNSQYQYGQGRQDRNFLDDRSYGTNLWQTQQARQDNVFDVDRGFSANRFDQQNANLFNLTNMGQNAAAGAANAGNIFASNAAQGNNNVAQTQANSALWQQGQRNNMFGSAMQLAGAYFGGGF